MTEGRQTGSFGDELTNAAMIGLVAFFGVALVLRAAGTLTAWLTGTAQPEGGLAAGVGVLFHLGDPGTALDAVGTGSASLVNATDLNLVKNNIPFAWTTTTTNTPIASSAGAPSLDLSGRLADTPIRLRSGPVGFAYPGALSARAVDVSLGPPATASRRSTSAGKPVCRSAWRRLGVRSSAKAHSIALSPARCIGHRLVSLGAVP